MGKNKETVK